MKKENAEEILIIARNYVEEFICCNSWGRKPGLRIQMTEELFDQLEKRLHVNIKVTFVTLPGLKGTLKIQCDGHHPGYCPVSVNNRSTSVEG